MIDRTSQLDTIRWSECPYCAETVSNDSVTCADCAEPVPPRTQPARPARPVVQCEKCQGQMAKRVIARYGSALRGIGFVLGFRKLSGTRCGWLLSHERDWQRASGEPPHDGRYRWRYVPGGVRRVRSYSHPRHRPRPEQASLAVSDLRLPVQRA